MTQKTILLVEDNPQNEMLTLRRANVANTVDVARDGQQALDYLFRAGNYANRTGPGSARRGAARNQATTTAPTRHGIDKTP